MLKLHKPRSKQPKESESVRLTKLIIAGINNRTKPQPLFCDSVIRDLSKLKPCPFLSNEWKCLRSFDVQEPNKKNGTVLVTTRNSRRDYQYIIKLDRRNYFLLLSLIFCTDFSEFKVFFSSDTELVYLIGVLREKHIDLYRKYVNCVRHSIKHAVILPKW